MKTTIVLCVLMSALPAICRSAEGFYLTNSVTHTNYGPFVFAHGGKVTIGNQTLEIRMLLTDDERIGYRMRNIVIPEIDFRGATISNVVEYFQGTAAEYEDWREDDGTNTLLFVFEGRPDLKVPGTTDGNAVFSARFVSLYAALWEVCRIADLDFKIRNNTVILFERKPNRGQQGAAPVAAGASVVDR
ncbi:MAG: hypothetical protein WCR06_09495 [bacterium]